MASTTFPRFNDGDVEIHLSSTDGKYVLHNYLLALHSPWFKASLSERWSNGGTESTSIIGGSGSGLLGGTGTVGKSSWVYMNSTSISHLGMLTKKPSSPRATEMITGAKDKLPNGTPKAAAKLHTKRLGSVKAHEDMLGTLYHLAPAFSHETFEKAKASILVLANVADIYGCQHVTKMHIESHLRLYREEVLDLCASDPLSMLELAIAVKSEWIFMEAVTNVIGCSKRFFEVAQLQFANLGIAELMNKKRTQFYEKLLACEYTMLRMQPLITDKWAPVAAVAFFKQWLSDCLDDNMGSALGSGYGNLYHAICKPTTAAKTSRKLKALAYSTTLFKNGNETIDEFMNHVDFVFERAATIVKPIRKDITRRQDKKSDAHRSLTFMGVCDEELPWAKK